MTYRIELSCDTTEAPEFLAWLRANGHDATICRSTSDYVDGVRTASNAEARAIMESLWSAYCAHEVNPTIAEMLASSNI